MLLCVMYYDRSAGLWGLNGRRGRVLPPSIQLCIGGMLPVENGEIQNRGQQEGKITDAAVRIRCALLCVKCV